MSANNVLRLTQVTPASTPLPPRRLERAALRTAFLRDPIGRWFFATPTTIVFAATPDLFGCVAWGRPSAQDIEQLLECCAGVVMSPNTSPRFDLLLDGRRVEAVLPAALATLTAWLRARRDVLAERVRLPIGVVADNLVGATFSGVAPMLGMRSNLRLERDLREALRSVSPTASGLADEVEEWLLATRAGSCQLHALRELLRARSHRTSARDAARGLGLSLRTFQRVLRESGTTFRKELHDARYSAACELLAHRDNKVAVVAARVGVSENALGQLVRARAGVTPAQLRRFAR